MCLSGSGLEPAPAWHGVGGYCALAHPEFMLSEAEASNLARAISGILAYIVMFLLLPGLSNVDAACKQSQYLSVVIPFSDCIKKHRIMLS